uniref:G protein-coupled receptor n=1 Tax=Romanomermis culicivorax TaxID=13658 RepID=A0A915HQN4_ROMCU
MSNNASPVEVDQISLYGLRVAFPGFILWDIFAVVNILSIILSIYVITLTKFMTPLLRKVIILHLLIEAIFSVEAAVMASYHLHVYSQGVPETMKPYDCLKYISTTFVLVHYSYWLMLLCSLDRMLAIFRPNFYKAGGHRRPINRVLVAITIFQFLELTGYHLDTYDDDLIPLCLPKQALGAHSLPYYSCMSVILSITPPIIYLSCFVYLFYKDAVGHPDGAGVDTLVSSKLEGAGKGYDTFSAILFLSASHIERMWNPIVNVLQLFPVLTSHTFEFNLDAAVMTSYHLHVYSQGVPETGEASPLSKIYQNHVCFGALFFLADVDVQRGPIVCHFPTHVLQNWWSSQSGQYSIGGNHDFKFLELTGYHLDTFDDDLIPLCLPKQALGTFFTTLQFHWVLFCPLLLQSFHLIL